MSTNKYNLTEKKQKNPLYRTLVNPQLVEELYQKIMAKFVVEKKYKDPEYSAQKLAKELDTNSRYISAVINLRFQDNYSQMVNEFRIKDAMYMLKDKHCMRMSMEDIASQVGFSNRQSFYAAFYKRTGCTPRDFRMKAINEIENQKKERLEKRKSKLAKAQAEKAK
ncbi:MAG: helix-turn-helix domain-containing protein [Paraprevotella sp.]|nr:AraC family transcriptional regulator [Bacteroidaceae bacterium]MCI6373560.1 helix-turn-helix domain-containing protein [Paraprevotella sp.]MCI6742984.1 helix-turn-helix domain-containing protein [Paraprevotella sp.]MCI7082480.1 helix-turn-helix domain-containing protein [Paraprevotella sp.]MCI7141493.1 helix-turn-helix domain-containing protein [Paraprevotella sp.]